MSESKVTWSSNSAVLDAAAQAYVKKNWRWNFSPNGCATGPVETNVAIIWNANDRGSPDASSMSKPDDEVVYSCKMPDPPAAIDGASATRQQIADARDATTKYLADSDKFQDCVGIYRNRLRQHDFLNGLPPNKDEEDRVFADVVASQAAKKKAADAINAAIAAYKTSHP